MNPVPSLYRRLQPKDLQLLNRRLAERRMTYDEIRDWLGTLGYRTTKGAIQAYAIASKKRRLKPRGLLRIDRILSPDDRLAYENLISDPRTTNEAALAWLTEHGYSACMTAVARHRRRFFDMLDSVRDSARLAREILLITRVPGTADLSEGMLTRMEQLVFEQLVLLKERKKIHPKDLNDLARAVSQAMNTRETHEGIRRQFEKTTREAMAAGEAAANSGATGKDVVDRMKELLGV